MRTKQHSLAAATLAALYLTLLVNVIDAQYYGQCNSDEFACHDGVCILDKFVCDNVPDCADGEDEISCETTTHMPTTPKECYVSDEKICNGVLDCPDGSDEDPEVCGCDSTEFKCKEIFECIKSDKVCNGYADCTDDSDELNCGNDTDICTGNSFQCENLECINIDFRCDQNQDCTDGSDERNCNYDCRWDQWACVSGECIPSYEKCDGVPNCRDGSDENCGPIPPMTPSPPISNCRWDEWTCLSGECIPSYQKCDRYRNCRDGSDEVSCYEIPTQTTQSPFNPPPGNETRSSSLDLKIEDNSQTVKEEGEDVVFRCRDHGLKRAQVKWLREGNLPFQVGYSDDGHGRLELYNVSSNDGGGYICKAISFAPSSRNEVDYKTVFLTVHRRAPPSMIPTQLSCPRQHTQCNDGKCIPKSAICDGHRDCSDGSDELSCGDKCEPNEFRCGNGRCIQVYWVCDSFDDCYDNSDENNCPYSNALNEQCSVTQFTCKSGECIGKNLHCDGQPDCFDKSDEVGCSQVYISQLPPRSEFKSRGESMVISCTAIGVPPPVIVWRLNWGHIPKKCVYTSDVSPNGSGATVVGTLTCPDLQYEDQGAYSCEAINNKGSVFAVPDTILTVNGSSVGGKCPTGYFNSLAESDQDCISCFCFGVTTRCRSADLYTYQIPTPLGEGGTYLLGLEQNNLGKLIEYNILDNYDYQSRFRNEATVTKVAGAHQSNIHPYLALPENYNEMQLTSYGGYIKYKLKPHNRIYEYSNMPDVVIKGKYVTLVYHAPKELSSYSRAELHREVRILPPHWSKITNNGIKSASREDIMMALDNVERIMLRADYNGGGVNITNFKMDSAQQENYGLGVANFVEECECPPGYEGLSCHKCKDGYERINSGPWLGLCRRVDEVCPPGTYGEPRRGIPCRQCPCPSPSNRFAESCYLDKDGQVTCNCNSGYTGRRCELCENGLIGNPLVPGDSCREPPSSLCNPYGTAREINGECRCKQKVEGAYCDKCTNDSFLLSPDNLYGCAQCFCMGMTDQCSSSYLRRSTITAKFNSPQDRTDIYVIQGSPTRYKEPKRAPISPHMERGELILAGLDLSGSKTYYWSVPESLTGNKVTSYGGFLTYSLKHWPAATPQNLYNAPAAVTIFSKNMIPLHNYGNVSMSSSGHLNGSVQLIETNWRRIDGTPVQRSDFLMALADVDKILIRATYTFNTQEADFISTSIDIAETYGTGPRAVNVEECRCPKNYVGTSCEDCAPGYSRGTSGIYLANCEPCNCNGKSDQCHPETGVCINCQENTSGDHCEECLPGFLNTNGYCVEEHTTHPYENGAQCNCDPRGESGPCYSNGQCRCKQNVEGQMCNVCRPGTFNLDMKNSEGCLTCFCSGVSTECQSALSYKRIPMPVYALNEQHGFTLQTIEADHVINDNIILNQEYNQLGYIFGNYAPSDDLYWSLPMLPGNRITSYGGNLTITQKFESGNYEETSNPAINVVLVGDDLTIFWNNLNTVRSGQDLKYIVPLREDHWRHLSGPNQVTRDNFLSVLASLRRVLVLASLSPGTTSTYIADVSMDTALPNADREGDANEVELCRCPPGYDGTSCETCVSGYYRDQSDKCVECPCNGNADSCQIDSYNEVVCNCRLPYSGKNCAGVDSRSSLKTTQRPPIQTSVTVQIIKPLIKIFSLGSTVNYTCTARSSNVNSPLKVTWRKDAGVLPLGRAYTDASTGTLLINNVQVSDSGTYVCEAGDGISVRQAYVSLTVSPNPNSPPVVTIEPSYKSAYEGELITLNCRTTGMPKPDINWVRTGQALPYGAEFEGGVLTIPYARVSDSGEYRCLAQNPAGSAEAVSVISVSSKPGQELIQLTITPTKPYIQEGQSAQISCKASSSDVPSNSLVWSRENRGYLPSNFQVMDGTLHISNPIPDDNDVYVCRSSSKEFTITPVRVSVNVQPLQPAVTSPDEKPTITLQVNTTTIPTGGSASIDCIPRGYPLPIVTWRKHAGEFGPGVSQRGNSLIINKAEDLDSGYYICEARLPNGDQLAPSYLIIYIEKREKPEINISPTGVQAVELGSTFDLRCWVTKGIPEPVITWSRKSGRAMSPATKLLTDNILRFTDISINDEGEYICTASNIVGHASIGTTLSVQSAPRITITPDYYIEAKAGEFVKVDCRASGYPEPLVHWRRESQDKQDLGSPTPGIASLIIDRLSERDEGEYTCFAKSSVGTRKEQIFIAVKYDVGNTIEPGQNNEPTARPYNPNPYEPNFIAVYAPEGTNFKLNCQTGPLHPDDEISWTRTDGNLISPYIIRENSLVWDSIRKQDEGTYQCSIVDRYTQTPRLAAQKQVFVEMPPRVTLNPPSQIVRPLDVAVVECVVDGDEPIEIRWEPASGHFSRRVQIENTMLKFNQIEVEDAGIYTCFARNRVANATGTAEVIVTGSPRSNDRVIIDKPRRPITEGSDVVVTCRGSPNTLELSWEKPVPGGPTQYVNAKNSPGFSTLDISNVQRSDAGVYRCIGRNLNRQVYDEFDLVVEPAITTPEYSREDKIVEADLGSTVRLTCTDNGERLSNVEWKHSFGPTLNVTEPELILHNITEADAGTYTCRWMTENHAIDTQTVLRVVNVVPMFNGQSWLSLKPMPALDIFSKLSFEISIKPQGGDGIILYNSEKKSPNNDFIALRLINGEPEFQFNAGAEIASLRGDRPLDLNKWHMIRIDRNFNKLSMTVNNNDPFTTDYNAHAYVGLELHEPIYIGGVPEEIQLPYSLNDVRSGFVGCVSMLILNMEEKSLMREKIDDSGTLAECQTCAPNLCGNGGICQEAQNERGYSCLCKAGFAGHDCNRTGEACRPGLCGPGKCTDTADSYKCTCPSTHSGNNCEISQTLTYPAFAGSGFLAFEPLKGARTLKMTMKIKPVAPVTDGILMYCSEASNGNGGFASLAVKNGYLEFMYDTGDSDQPTVVRSPDPLKANNVTTIAINRSVNKIIMTIDNLQKVSDSIPNGKKQMRWATLLYIGGYDETAVTINKKIQVTGGFNGCIQDVTVQTAKLDINKSKGVNVRECSTSKIERGDIPYNELSTSPNDVQRECQCRNNGQCRRDGSCKCPAGYHGTYCEHRQPRSRLSCSDQPAICRSGGTCRDTQQGYNCDCMLGYTGRNCETSISLQQNAHFQGDGYVAFPSNLLDYKSPDLQTVAIRLNTDRDGVILYQHSTSMQTQYILLKVENRFVTLNWDLGGGMATLQSSVDVTDDEAHTVIVTFDRNEATLTVDGDQVAGTANKGPSDHEINSEIYIGGIPSWSEWHRQPGLSGCIQQIEFTDGRQVDIGHLAVDGVNVDRCKG